jgi:molybdate transport system substrate-binding protein
MKLSIRWRAAVLVTLCALMIGCKKEPQPGAAPTTGPAAAAKELDIAAAADLQYALETVSAKFREAHPDVDVKITYGSSGNFFSHISNHAPFDLFLSADTSYPEKLLASGEAVKGSEFNYAIGRIVLWAPTGSKFDPANRKMDALTDPDLKRIAIANPDHAPYGRAAEAALKTYKLWDTLQPKIVKGGNISETATMVRTGGADVGIIALSLALAPSMKDAGTYYEIPAEDYPALKQEGVILSYAKNPDAAAQFKQFLLGSEARTILEQFGFAMPKE